MIQLSRDLKLPLEAVTQTFALLGMRGVGKTWAASVLAEELSKPFVVLDPTGAWFGLRSSADGKSEGYPVTILGGDHADAPLEEQAGKVIADLVAEEAPSLILDMSRLSKSAMRRFVADFAERLYEKNRNPLHLIVDEGDAFAPQKPRSDELRMLGAIDEIVRRGRIRGLGCTLVTQRSSVLNKDVLTQTEVLVALRTAHPRDREPVLEWMKVHATKEQLEEVVESLAKLPKGGAWVMSAGWLDLFKRVHIRERRTFNSSATPEPGQRRVVPRRLAPVDLKALEKRMAATIERARAEDPRELRKRIAELERELSKAGNKITAKGQAPEPKRVEVPVVKPAELKRLEALVARVNERMTKALEPVERLVTQYHEAAVALGAAVQRAHSAPPALARPAPAPLPRRAAFANNLGRLSSDGLIRYPGPARVELTDSGRAAAVLPERPPTTEELHQTLYTRLSSPQGAILRALIAAYPESLAREDLAEQARASSSSSAFANNLGTLRSLGLIGYPDRGRVVALAVLFLEGQP